MKLPISYRLPKNEIFEINTVLIEQIHVDNLISTTKKLLENFKEERIPINNVDSTTMYNFFKENFTKDLFFIEWVAMEISLHNFQSFLDTDYYSPFAFDMNYLIGGTCKD
eukprot:TRINITY_DN1149_c0_g1_i1.p1 TRINITY_DN1149_c0_g1~~TRINITY_DN1149_c0_g1_i1.p1  ORF type:complete len:110 (-),score=21.60 TRINITY_DN1149_c0_g1_i1:227-556(-)